MFVDKDMSNTGSRHIGYWATSRSDNALPWPHDFVDPNWDCKEAEAVAAYLDSQPKVQQYLGYSWCRFGCKELDMGTADLSDGTYTWPAGFSHYIRVHKVRPPQKFIDWCLRCLKTQMTYTEWVAEGKRRFGPDTDRWEFVCPVCNHVQSVAECRAAGVPENAIGFSCIGRWLAKSKDAFTNTPKSGPCTYAGGGLFKLNPVAVQSPNGNVIDMFAFAR